MERFPATRRRARARPKAASAWNKSIEELPFLRYMDCLAFSADCRARSISISSAISAVSANTEIPTGLTSANPLEIAKRLTFRRRSCALNSPGRNRTKREACPGRTPSSPSCEGSTTNRTSSSRATFSGVNTSSLKVFSSIKLFSLLNRFVNPTHHIKSLLR